ncbi:hypothetical protein ACHQM5_030416 [Ranunculus cassubicifolius]
MSDSREGSPDWLHCFKAPQQLLTLSSDSDESPHNSGVREDDDVKEEPDVEVSKGDQNKDTVHIDSEEDAPVTKPVKSKSPKARVKSETKKRKADDVAAEPIKEEITEKPVEPHVSSRLPLVMSDKVQRSKALVECEGEAIDMSGDVGAVGRVVITDPPSGDPEMLLDLKGTIYRTTIIPSRTFCVVSFNQTEAKIEAIMNDFIQLQPVSNVYEAETMIEGTLDGFSFESDDEADKIAKLKAPPQGDQNNEGDDELNNGKTKKTKGKAEKSSGATRKKGKAAAKPPKKTQKKTQASKKPKTSKK